MPLQFNAEDWYWFVGGDQSKVYSSYRNIYVDPATDNDFGIWAASTNANPYPVGSEAEIWYYVQDYLPLYLWNGVTMSQPAEGAWYKPQLDNYNATARFNKVNGGMVAAGVPVKTDDYSRNLIQGGMTLAQADSNFTAQWFGSDGNFYTIDAPQMIEMGTTVGTHTNTCYTVFQSNSAGITDNTITTLDQIDNAYVGL
jgi:hypothetical protein